MKDFFNEHDRLPDNGLWRFLDLIEELDWTEAKTKTNPHEYAVLNSFRNPKDIVFMSEFISKYGVRQRWAKWVYNTIRINGYVYWNNLELINGRWVDYKPIDSFGKIRITIQNRRKLDYDGDYSDFELYNKEFGKPEYIREDLAVMDILDIGKKDKVLDFGCGDGLLLKYKDIGKDNYIGIDVSGSGIDLAREKYPDHCFINAPINEFYYKGKADVIVSLYGSPSYFNQTEINVMKQYLKKGGRLYAMFFKNGYYPMFHNVFGEGKQSYQYMKDEAGEVLFDKYVMVTNINEL